MTFIISRIFSLLLHQMPQLRVVGDTFFFAFNDFNDV